jgi:hypothetical protein
MKTSLHSGSSSQPGFALISVLALVSLAALTATAFLASARLERQATRPIGETTRLQMTLNTGRECASEVINRVGEPYWNFVTTYWRTNSTNELGYLFVGKPSASNNLIWYYYCGFTPAQWTNLDSADMNTRIRATNTVCQATYSNNMQIFMNAATSGFSTNPGLTNPTCVQIPLLGGLTSPTVGWVYIKQDIRTNPSSTNTSNLPVARFAYFIEDLGGLIDAERMCGTINRNTGTNAEEISLANLAGSSASNIPITTLTNKRSQYLTPGMLLATNGGVLTSTNDLRYFASRLRYCNWTVNENWDRIPYVPISSSLVSGSYYPSQAGQRKTNLGDTTLLNLGGATKIAATINANYPMFTNRAGGMNGVTYVNALAANIVDYADTDSTPTTVGNAVGFDSCPYPTIIFNKYLYTNTTKSLSVQTFIQLWNLSTATSPASGPTLTYNLNDVYSNKATPMLSSAITATLTVPKLLPNQGAIVSTPVTTISLAGDITNTPVPTIISINSNSYATNTKFSLAIGGQTYVKMNTGFERKAKTVTSSPPDWSGGMPGLGYAPAAYGAYNVPSLGDPRMTFYLTNMSGAAGNLSARDYNGNTVWNLGYPQTLNATATDNFKGLPLSGGPQFWPDSSNSTTSVGSGTTYADTVDPATGVVFTPPGLAPCKISNTGSYSNITELGNIFDPMQWMKTITTLPQWVNYDVDTASAAHSMYGGGQTLRIGRPEHSRFTFTNLVTGGNPVPRLGTSAAGLLDLFCATNVYNWAGKININTAPPPVLAALAGGISLTKDPNKVGSPVNANMINQFTNGVMRFRNMYPFITPSQLAFISANYGTTGWTNSSVWTQNAIFGTNALGGGLAGVTSINDESREEWFSKIYNLTCVQSFNYRIYVVAQLTDTKGNPKGAMMRKYYQLHLRYNAPNGATAMPPTPPDKQSPSVSPVVTYEAFY